MDAQVTVGAEDVQVAAKPRRRTYTAEYKRRILKEADACTTPGAVGALLRREGLYSSHLVVWRRARGRGELAALAPRQRGRKPTPVDARDRKIAELERQLTQMTGRAERAEALVLVDAQKNLAALLGRPGCPKATRLSRRGRGKIVVTMAGRQPVSFVKRVRGKDTPQPSHIAHFDPNRWEAEFSAVAGPSIEDRRLFEAGLWFARRFQAVSSWAAGLDFGDQAPSELARYHCGLANRESHVVQSMTVSQPKGSEPYIIEQVIQSQYRPDGAEWGLHPEELLESIIDGLKIALDSLVSRPVFANRRRSDLPDQEVLRSVKTHLLLGSYYSGLVSLWNDCVWNGWYVDETGPIDKILSSDSDADIARVVSKYRQDALQLQVLPGLNLWRASLTEEARQVQARVRLIGIEGSGKKRRLLFDRTPPDSDASELAATIRVAADELYFTGFMNVRLPQMGNISLGTVLDAWEALAFLATVLAKRLPKDGAVRSLHQLNEYSPTITESEAIEVLTRSLSWEPDLAARSLRAFTRPMKSRDEFWHRPLLDLGNRRYAPIVHALRLPNLMRSIEHWAKVGGVDMSIRGPLFERFARSELSEAIGRSRVIRNAIVHPERLIVRFPEGKEDFDLVLRIGQTLLIGEAKCGLYPGLPYEWFNYHQVLAGAVRQIKRKARRTEDHPDVVVQALDHSGRLDPGTLSVFPFVLVNSAFGAGAVVDSVPVVDVRLLVTYFERGFIEHFVKFLPDGRQSGGEREDFYRTEEEAEQRVTEYLISPPQTRGYREHLSTELRPWPRLTDAEKPVVIVERKVLLPLPSGSYQVEQQQSRDSLGG